MKEMKKILIGDDTADYGITTASALRSYGLYAITRRKDGNVLMNAILEECPHVVIIDSAINFEALKTGLLFENFDENKIIQVANLSQAVEALAKYADFDSVVLFENDLPDNYS